MKPQSAKAKGRRFQQWIAKQLIERLGIHPEDIESRSMGAGGEDLILAKAAREKFPFSVEAKNQERVNIWKSYQQAQENAGKYIPLLCIKKNRTEPLVVLSFNDFISLLEGE